MLRHVSARRGSEPGFCLVGGSGKGGVQHFLHVWQRSDVRLLPGFPLVDRSCTHPEVRGEITDTESQRLPEQLRFPTSSAVNSRHGHHTLLMRNIARSVVPATCARRAPLGHQEIVSARPCCEQAVTPDYRMSRAW
jgi:hypothetical protein